MSKPEKACGCTHTFHEDCNAACVCGGPAQVKLHGGPPAQVIPVLSSFDPVSKPRHYNLGGIECIDAIKAATVGLTGIEAVDTAQVIKYAWRWKHKEKPVEDLKKAKWYLEHLIAELGG